MNIVTYMALLIAPDGHVEVVRNLPSVEACVSVVEAYRSEVFRGRGNCVRIEGKHS